MSYDFDHTPHVAYFSMEIAVRSEIPTYSGGLGVLAGDTLRAAADLSLPMVAVSLASRLEYHMNEGHSALLTLELLRRSAYPDVELRPGEPRYDIPRVRELCNFTTHTPVKAGHDQFDYALVERVLGAFIDAAISKNASYFNAAPDDAALRGRSLREMI